MGRAPRPKRSRPPEAVITGTHSASLGGAGLYTPIRSQNPLPASPFVQALLDCSSRLRTRSGVRTPTRVSRFISPNDAARALIMRLCPLRSTTGQLVGLQASLQSDSPPGQRRAASGCTVDAEKQRGGKRQTRESSRNWNIRCRAPQVRTPPAATAPSSVAGRGGVQAGDGVLPRLDALGHDLAGPADGVGLVEVGDGGCERLHRHARLLRTVRKCLHPSSQRIFSTISGAR